jgi:hypothetical protein
LGRVVTPPDRRVESGGAKKVKEAMTLEVIASLTGWQFILDAISVAVL